MEKNIKIPIPYWKRYFILNKLRKESHHRILYHFNDTAYSDLNRETITLPMIQPLEYADLKILLKHEELHFDITKEAPEIYLSDYEFSVKLQRAINIVDDNVINEKIGYNKVKIVLSKLGDKSLIGIWDSLSEDEKLSKIKDYIKNSLIKEEVDAESAKKILQNAIDFRRKNLHLSGKNLVDEEPIQELAKILNIDCSKDPGDGPEKYKSSYTPPDWNLHKQIFKIFKRFIITAEKEIYLKKWYGKKLNRKWIEVWDVYPMKDKKTSIERDIPSVAIILDGSGSMSGSNEAKAKAFALAAMQTINANVFFHNQYIRNKKLNQSTVINIPMTGDEKFDTLDPALYKKYDILILLTDLNISDSERRGVYNIMKNRKGRNYVLCTNTSYSPYELEKVAKIVNIENEEKLINFIKKLVWHRGKI